MLSDSLSESAGGKADDWTDAHVDAPVPTVLVSTLTGRVLEANDAAGWMLGRVDSRLRGVRLEDILEVETLLGGALTDLRRFERPDRSPGWCRELRIEPDPNDAAAHDAGRPQLVFLPDVTESMRLAHQLEETNHRLRMLTEASPDIVLRVDAAGTILDANRSACTTLGITLGRTHRTSLSDLFAPQQLERVDRAVQDAVNLGHPVDLWREWLSTGDRTAGWHTMRFIPESSVERSGSRPIEATSKRGGRARSTERAERSGPAERSGEVYIVCSNTNELVDYEHRLANIALIDPLTGAMNRAATFDRLQHAVDRLERRPELGVAIAVVGVDHFMAINNAHGHHMGDSALVAVANELRRTVRGQDTVGRLGGDEFVIVLEEVESRQEAAVLGARLEAAVASVVFDDSRASAVQLTASVGVAWSDDQVTADEFVGRGRKAMKEAKRRGRARAWLEQPCDGSDARQAEGPSMIELSAALTRDQFEMYYQPIVGAVDGRPYAVEALLRWRHPEYGVLAPDRFLGWLLENGQMSPVGQWALRTSIRQLGHWQREHPELAKLALHVNLTAGELAHPDLPSVLSSEIDRAGVDAETVCIEVTEQALAGVMVSPSTLATVAEVGVRIVLDDFGTGISSLSHLRTRPLHGIKVDRSFVAGADQDSDDRSIVEGIVAIAAGLGIETTAEGVETPEQVEWLASLGCTFLQGFHFAHPSEPDQIPALLGV